MDFILTAIAFVVIFSLLVLIHEWGHFFTARRAGIKVEEFGFGLPPRIWGFKKKGVLYSLNAIPFGGFVRLLGQDSSDPSLAKNKKSFIAQPPRVRILVVCAGVIMNFLLAFVLLTIGFSFGIQPLILTSDDLLQNIQQGQLDLEQGLIVKEVVNNSAADTAGLEPHDRIVAIDDQKIVAQQQLQLFDPKKNADPQIAHQLLIDRNGSEFTLYLHPEGSDLGIRPYQSLFLPRAVIEHIDEGSLAAQGGFQVGDILLMADPIQSTTEDDTHLYSSDDISKVIQQYHNEHSINFSLIRNNQVMDVALSLPQSSNIVIAKVSPGSPASQAGIQPMDAVENIDGISIENLDSIHQATKFTPQNPVKITLLRQGERITSTVIPDTDGHIGVIFATLNHFDNIGWTLYQGDTVTSVITIHDVKYSLWEAPIKAFQELGRLSVLTVEMFGSTIRTMVTHFTIPEGISGPVGIAQMTYVFVQEGFLSLIRFAALLSISLAIINVLPVPALDGGRLFFIIIEVIRGKKLDSKFEGIVHAIGFLLLMVFIFSLVYNDILKLIF